MLAVLFVQHRSFCIVLHVLFLPSTFSRGFHFIFTVCTQNHSSSTALQKNKKSVSEHIIDRNIWERKKKERKKVRENERREKKKDFPCFPSVATCSIVLSASLPSRLWSDSTHPRTSINATCDAATPCTHILRLAWGHAAEASEHRLCLTLL